MYVEYDIPIEPPEPRKAIYDPFTVHHWYLDKDLKVTSQREAVYHVITDPRKTKCPKCGKVVDSWCTHRFFDEEGYDVWEAVYQCWDCCREWKVVDRELIPERLFINVGK